MKDALLRALRENWGLKLLSLGIALLLWMFVVGEKRSEVSLLVPLEMVRVPEAMVIVSPVPEGIRVRLNGPRTLVAALNAQQLSFPLDLEGIQPGISAFEILPSRLNLPRGIEVTYVSPSVITLEADRRVRKRLPVKARVRGTPAEGFEVLEAQVTPVDMEFEGAERALKQLKEVPTEFVDVTGLEGGVTRPAQLAPPPSIRPVGKPSVQVQVQVREMRAEREFLQVPVGAPSPGLRTVPVAVDVRVDGPLRAIARLAAGDVTALAGDSREAGPDGSVPVAVRVPEGIRLLGVVPERARLVPADPEQRLDPAPVPGAGAGGQAPPQSGE